MQLLASETSKFLVKEMKKKLNGKSAGELDLRLSLLSAFDLKPPFQATHCSQG